METLISPFIFAAGILYGLIRIFIEITKKSNMNKRQLGMSIGLIVLCAGSLFIIMD